MSQKQKRGLRVIRADGQEKIVFTQTGFNNFVPDRCSMGAATWVAIFNYLSAAVWKGNAIQRVLYPPNTNKGASAPIFLNSCQSIYNPANYADWERRFFPALIHESNLEENRPDPC